MGCGLVEPMAFNDANISSLWPQSSKDVYIDRLTALTLDDTSLRKGTLISRDLLPVWILCRGVLPQYYWILILNNNTCVLMKILGLYGCALTLLCSLRLVGHHWSVQLILFCIGAIRASAWFLMSWAGESPCPLSGCHESPLSSPTLQRI